MNADTYRGHWWLPGIPDEVATGQLVVDASGRCTLELVGSLDLSTAAALEHPGDPDARAIWQQRVRVIHGQVRHQAVTLLDCFVGDSDSPSHAGRSHLDVVAQKALIGAHVAHDEPVFRSARVEIENLTAWLGIDDQVNREGNADEETAALGRTGDAVVDVDGWKFTARLVPNSFQATLLHAKADIRSDITAYLFITAPEPRPARDYEAVVLEFMDLLTLSSQRPSGQIRLTLVHRDDQVTRARDGVKHEIETHVQSFGRRIHTAEPEAKAPYAWDFLFRCADVPFEQIVPAWLRLRRTTADACNVFFGLQYARPAYTEARLLLVATVAEALSVGLNADDPQRAQVSYRNRLRRLAEIPDSEAVRTIIPDVEVWAHDLHLARNSLAHTGNDDGERDIFELEWVTSSLISLALMAELGLSAEMQRRAATTVLKLPW